MAYAKLLKKYLERIVVPLVISILIVTTTQVSASAVILSGKLPIGSYVQFGNYENKHIVWQVIQNDEKGSVLFAKDIITVKSFDAKGDKADGRDSKYNSRIAEGSNYWAKSNIREWLNSREQTVKYSHQKPDAEHTREIFYSAYVGGKSTPMGEDVSYADEPGFLTNFHDAELSAIQQTTYKTFLSEFDLAVKDGGSQPWTFDGDNRNAYYQLNTDKIFLLSIEELRTWVSGNGLPIEAPWYKSKTGWQLDRYWLRTPRYNYSSTVFRVPSMIDSNAYVPAGIRPALYLKPGYSMSGQGTAEAPYVIRYEVPIADISKVEIPSTGGNVVVSDQPSGWAEKEVNSAINNNLIDERLLNQYQKDITREEFCSLAVKLYEQLSGRKALYDLITPFSDTNNIDVRKAYNLKIVQGVSYNQFAPNNNITREQIAVMFYRTLEAVKNARPDISLDTTHKISFYDNHEIADWAVKAVTLMNHERIIVGTGTGFNPKGTATREQAFLLANRTYEKYKK